MSRSKFKPHEATRGPWSFVVQVPRDGYEWVGTPDGPYLVVKKSGGRINVPYAIGYTSPVRVKGGLHRRLWAMYTDTDPLLDTWEARAQGILDFANSQGMLLPVHPIPGTETAVSPPLVGVSLHEWANGIANIGRLVSLWDAIRATDTAALRQQIVCPSAQAHHPPETIVWRVSAGWVPAYEFTISRRRADPETFARWEHNTIEAAWSVLIDSLNQHLHGAVAPRLTMEEGTGKVEYSYTTTSLLAWAQLELYFEVTGQREPRRCARPLCSEWFTVGPAGGDKKAHARYCSEACEVAGRRAGIRFQTHKPRKHAESVTTSVTTATSRQQTAPDD